jgi:hypothetical protein
MITENDAVPICKEHDVKITRCEACQIVLAEFFERMPKKIAHPWNRDGETLAEFHYRERLADEENQKRQHSWATVHLYIDPLEDVYTADHGG